MKVNAMFQAFTVRKVTSGSTQLYWTGEEAPEPAQDGSKQRICSFPIALCQAGAAGPRLYIQKSRVTSLKWMALQCCSSWLLLLQRAQPSCITLSPLPASLCRSSRDINPSLGTASDDGRWRREGSPGFLPGHKTQLQLPRGTRDTRTSAHGLTAWLLFPTERQLLCPLSWQPACS